MGIQRLVGQLESALICNQAECTKLERRIHRMKTRGFSTI